MASIPKLIVLSGLPGSGKSHLLRSAAFDEVTGLRVHDFHANAINHSSSPINSRHFRAVIEALKAGHDCIIADIEFCREVRRNAVVEAIRHEVPEVRVEFHCFRNQPDRCKANVLRRARTSVEEELRKVDEITRFYVVPGNAVEYDVFEARDKIVPDRLFEILRKVESDEHGKFPKTEIFNEGWMMRLVLDALERNPSVGLPVKFLNQSARWFSEARLSSPFRPRIKMDPLGEGFTHADGIIGHVEFRPGTSAGLRLNRDARQFVVVEAKMTSGLSAGTRNAPSYNQAARNVACMAKTISDSGIQISDLQNVGFFVVAPKLELRQQARRGTNLERLANVPSIRSAISERIGIYKMAGREEEYRSLRTWEETWCEPLLQRLCQDGTLAVLAWEDVIDAIHENGPGTGETLRRFYRQCLRECQLGTND